MTSQTFVALTFAVLSIGSVRAAAPVGFKLTEPVSVQGVPRVTLAPGSYVLRKIDRAGGANVVQVLSKGQDYVYTTVLTIPCS